MIGTTMAPTRIGTMIETKMGVGIDANIGATRRHRSPPLPPIRHSDHHPLLSTVGGIVISPYLRPDLRLDHRRLVSRFVSAFIHSSIENPPLIPEAPFLP